MQFKPYLPMALALGLAMTAVQAAPPAGQLLASQCAQCHGTNGNGPGFDKLAGSSAREIANEMLEMKYRSTPEGIMGRQSHGYTDAQIQLLADYLAGQTAATGNGAGTGGSSKADEKAAERAREKAAKAAEQAREKAKEKAEKKAKERERATAKTSAKPVSTTSQSASSNARRS